MAKRKETLEIENNLKEMCTYKRLYGCEEITIGFVRQDLGNEIVDFMLMDSKGIIRCYEIKVTLADLKSKAKKSWYGHFNYLAVSDELYSKINDWSLYLPDHVGLIRFYGKNHEYSQVMKNPKKQELTIETELMLKESMVRSLFYKKEKYYNASNLNKIKELEKENRILSKEIKDLNKEDLIKSRMIRKFERSSGIDIYNYLKDKNINF